MPDEPIRTRVLLNMQEALRGMTVANGCFYDVAADGVSLDPERNLLTGASPGDKVFLVLLPEPGSTRNYYPANQLREKFTGSVNARVDVDPYDPTARLKAWERVNADVERRLVIDIGRGGLAVDTRLGEPQPFFGVGTGIVIVTIPFEVRLYREYGQP